MSDALPTAHRLNRYLARLEGRPVAPTVAAVLAGLDALELAAPSVAAAIARELRDQRSQLKLIASENFSSLAIQLAQGNLLTDKYAEGHAGHRFYAGCENVDAVESEAAELARRLFGAEHAYVQPHSTQAWPKWHASACRHCSAHFRCIQSSAKTSSRSLARRVFDFATSPSRARARRVVVSLVVRENGSAALDRRRVLCALGTLLVTGACRRGASRDAVLRGLVDEVVAADLVVVARRSRDLAWAARRLATAPAEPELVALRAAWRRAALAWKHASAFRAGPLVTGQALTRASYWPVRTAAVRDVLAGKHAVGAPLVAELGADVKGLYALEYLLFEQDGETTAWARLSSGPRATRARDLISAYADEVCAYGETARNALGSAGQGFASEFSRAGQQSVNSLVCLLAESVENLLAARLTLVLWLASLQRLRPLDVEGGPSRLSHELSLALLLASQRLYLGAGSGGLAELVERAAPAIHRRLVEVFAAAVAALRGLAAPIEAVALSDRKRVEAALHALKTLEVALKNDLPSSLGVTLAFTALDAD